VAYNFFVDRHGGIWEGRAGSLTGSVQGDATGGSQGFAQLCCFLGNHSLEPPTAAATESMLLLLAWLADRHGLDTSPGATTTFESRGSNRWSAGTLVTTATIAGHRDMSATECPGELLYPAVRDGYQAEVTARRSMAHVVPSTQPSEPGADQPAPTEASTPATGDVSDTTAPEPTTSAASSSTTLAASPSTTQGVVAPQAPVPSDQAGGGDRGAVTLLAAGAVAAAAGGGLLLAQHRARPDDDSRDQVGDEP
jgi:hypothetical protein